VSLTRIALDLRREVDALSFAKPVTHVYNPLRYAWAPHRQFLQRFGTGPKKALFVGMNPGPWGMAQTGVPFGEVAMVGDWMGIGGKVSKPPVEHPKRPVTGFACTRSEVSGKRLWGWARSRFSTPDAFFRQYFVWNYCPLSFMEQSGRNRTPDKLDRAEREALFAVCDRALARVVRALAPRTVVGIGRFAQMRCGAALDEAIPVIMAPHPSPASPLANRGWEAAFQQALEQSRLL
jgi:single-strand selective monofunctional uracil DNA glycosylase